MIKQMLCNLSWYIVVLKAHLLYTIRLVVYDCHSPAWKRLLTPLSLFISLWRNLKCDIFTRIYSYTTSYIVQMGLNCSVIFWISLNVLIMSIKPWANYTKHCCGNICDSRCFLKCFPVCPPVETLLRKQNLLPGKQKCFLPISETFDVSLCFSLMFPSVCPLWETCMAKHWQETMSQQCFLVCPGLKLYLYGRVP
jgi:hypothetical protein